MARRQAKTVFERFMGEPNVKAEIHQGKHRKVVLMGPTSFPIIDGHLVVCDEWGEPMAFCRRDLETILETMPT